MKPKRRQSGLRELTKPAPASVIATTNHPQTAGASFIELAAIFTGLAILITAQLQLSGMQNLVYHPLWLDECLTQLLATDPSFFHAMAAIRGGVETNPPTLYLFLWPLAQLVDGDAVTLRAFAAASMLFALVGVYAICRLFFDRVSSLIGTLALAAHPLVIAQMFEARFYGPWLAATTWFVYSMLIEPRESNRIRLTIVRCILAILLATIHWFGVISLLLIGVTDLAIRPGVFRDRVLRALPLLCGVLASLACIPFFLGQRNGLSVPTWMEPITLRIIARVARHVAFVPSMLALVAFAAWRWISKTSGQTPATHPLRDVAPLLALLIFPGIITMFSVLVQPALVDRYVIVTVAPLGVLVAALAHPMNSPAARWIGGAVIAGLIFAGGYEMRQLKYFNDIADARVGNAMTVTHETIDRNGPIPVIFRQRHDQYPVIHLDAKLADSVAALDFDGAPDPALTARTLYERDMARRVNRFYPRYRLATVAQLRQMRRFIVITPIYEQPELAAVLKDFRITLLAPEVYEVRYP